jgi:PAS domain S-box-containing protein
MKFNFKELVDVPILQELTDELYEATSIPSAIITMDGEILTGSGWQRICTHFHRQHPEAEKDCIESDIKIKQKLDEGESFVIYKCPRGLVDASSPVIIEGEHVANVFAGQLFMEPPDKSTERFFRDQARKFGFDEEEYIKAYREIPVYPEEKFRPALSFLSKFARLVANIGLVRIRELDTLDELKNNERKYRSLLESTQSVPWELDLATGKFTYMGPQIEGITGYPPDYWENMNAWSSTIHDEDREWAVNFCIEETKKGTDHEFEYRMLIKNGQERWIRDVVSVISGPNGPERLVGFMYDITEKKKAKLERAQLEEQLYQAQKMESIGRLAGGIAHDFNNILGSIMAHSEMLKMRFDGKNSFEGKSIESILRGVERAADLTKHLLGFARGGKYNPQPISLNETISEVLGLSEKVFEKNLTMKLFLDNKLKNIEADQGQISQVLTNIVINAKDAMPDGGDLSIRTENVFVDDEYIRKYPEFKSGNYVKITVSDTGIGMEESVKNRIFEPFYSTKEKGTGLGLATVYGIVKNHEGYIDVISEPGIGTEFKIFFPVTDKLIKQKKINETFISGNETILIVDDEEEILISAELALKKLGYKIITANSGAQAIKLYKKNINRIDLVILDIIMPEISGRETFLELKRIDPNVKVVLSSGYSREGKAKEILKEGAIAFLQKPYKLFELTNIINESIKKV